MQGVLLLGSEYRSSNAEKLAILGTGTDNKA